MARFQTAILLLSTLCLPACHSYGESYFVGQSTYQLAEVAEPDGPTVVYELRVTPGRAAFLNVIRTGEEPVQEIGLNLCELDKKRAKDCGVRPYTGLLVDTVEKGSPGEKAGLRPGDILLAVNSKEVYYLRNYNDVIAGLPADEPAKFQFRSTAHGAEVRQLQVTPVTHNRAVRDVKRVPLEVTKNRNPKPFAGFELRAVPGEYARKIYGDDRNAIVVTGVALGSPAYLAGMRTGDIIAKIDGLPVPDMAGILSLLRERGPRCDTVEFELTRDNGKAFKAAVELEDYTGVTRATVPLVFSSRASARSTDWDLGMGLVAGYANSYGSSDTREPAQSGYFSMLLGLFRFSWTPKGSHTRLLWFIDIG